MSGYQTLRAETLDQVGPGKGVVLDVRTDMEHDEKRLSRAHQHVPLDQLKPGEFMAKLGLGKDADVYLVCRSGKRAAKAAEMFAAEGYGNVHVIEGGLMACEACGQKVEGQVSGSAGGPISLERQVRIAAGSLVALGALLGLTVSPLFTLLPLAVGGGLVFAGLTDRCGLALLLTRAPWNKTSCSR